MSKRRFAKAAQNKKEMDAEKLGVFLPMGLVAFSALERAAKPYTHIDIGDFQKFSDDMIGKDACEKLQQAVVEFWTISVVELYVRKCRNEFSGKVETNFYTLLRFR